MRPDIASFFYYAFWQLYSKPSPNPSITSDVMDHLRIVGCFTLVPTLIGLVLLYRKIFIYDSIAIRSIGRWNLHKLIFFLGHYLLSHPLKTTSTGLIPAQFITVRIYKRAKGHIFHEQVTRIKRQPKLKTYWKLLTFYKKDEKQNLIPKKPGPITKKILHIDSSIKPVLKNTDHWIK